MSDELAATLVTAGPAMIVVLGAVIGYFVGDILGKLSVLRDVRNMPQELPKAPWED